MKKFEFTGETKTISLFFRTATLHRIRAVAEFGLVKIGDLGGWIEKEENLSHCKLICSASFIFSFTLIFTQDHL